LIQYGIKKSKLAIEELSLGQFLDSQQGSFNHPQTGLSIRIKQAKKKNKVIPPKRFGNEKVTFEFEMVQKTSDENPAKLPGNLEK
jgi:coenzyme F420 hydrogenase subunit beta